jgi:glycosyltransferase involved in cell wall biosynthesis
VLFAGRLVAVKGVEVLLQAMEIVRSRAWIEPTVIADGELRGMVQQFAERNPGRIRWQMPVPYGQPLLDVTDKHDCVVVPTLADEQPRIIYDACARGILVLASDTTGNRDCVRDGLTGWLVPVGDPMALANHLKMIAKEERGGMLAHGSAALSIARGRTHRAMHATRHALVAQALSTRAPQIV